MKRLGYHLTWQTDCFINGGCGGPVFAHTNGRGDFVLFDSIGPPWQVHECYVNRFCLQVRNDDSAQRKWVIFRPNFKLALREDTVAEYTRLDPIIPSPQNDRALEIERIEPEYFDGKSLRLSGFVREIVIDRVPKLLKNFGTLGAVIANKAIGERSSQVTIYDTDLASYTAFVDLRGTKIVKGDLVEATLKAIRVDGLKPPYRFIVNKIKRIDVFPE